MAQQKNQKTRRPIDTQRAVSALEAAERNLALVVAGLKRNRVPEAEYGDHQMYVDAKTLYNIACDLVAELTNPFVAAVEQKPKKGSQPKSAKAKREDRLKQKPPRQFLKAGQRVVGVMQYDFLDKGFAHVQPTHLVREDGTREALYSLHVDLFLHCKTVADERFRDTIKKGTEVAFVVALDPKGDGRLIATQVEDPSSETDAGETSAALAPAEESTVPSQLAEGLAGLVADAADEEDDAPADAGVVELDKHRKTG